jgi:hypothetical protein
VERYMKDEDETIGTGRNRPMVVKRVHAQG